MDYFDYINSIEPNADAKSKIRASAEKEFYKSKRIKLRQRTAFISAAACFVIFISVFAISSGMATAKGTDGEVLGSNEFINVNATYYCKCIHHITVNGEEYGFAVGNHDDEISKNSNGDVIIRKSELGKRICTIDEMKLCTPEKLNKEFYNVDIYEYKTTSLNTYVIAETEDGEYFLFGKLNGWNNYED